MLAAQAEPYNVSTGQRAVLRRQVLSEHQRWESRYAAKEYVFGKAPNYFLLAGRSLLPRTGKVLAVADGEGRNGVWLAEQGLEVLSLDFSSAAQAKGRLLAAERGIATAPAADAKLAFEQADVHTWPYPEYAYDVVVEIFTQFSTPTERAQKWAGMRRALKPGGLLILQGYTPKQREYGTGGPKEIEKLYTRDMLTEGFAGFHDIRFVEEELELHEGDRHQGLSAVIGMTARK
jgi:SAM-dependent methyltransferase